MDRFGLTGTGTLVLAVLLVMSLVVVTMMFWAPLSRLGWWRWPARAALLFAGQLAAVLVTALVLNNAFVFYQSWSELSGAHSSRSVPVSAVGGLDQRYRAQTTTAYRTGHGTLVPLPIRAVRGNVHTEPATVYLPPQYGDPAYANRRFPVMEVLDGFPGGPSTWTRRLHLATVLDSMIATGQAAPFIAVLPVQNVASPRDTECVNVVHGPQVDSYLSYDVRATVTTAFRVLTSGSQWTLIGDSTGGYCATDLALRHPGMFGAAASIAGYNAPAHDATTRNLFGNDPSLARFYSPSWLVRHRHRQPVPLQLLLISTKVDRTAYHASLQLAATARPPLAVSTLTLPRGGHNFATFSAELPTALGWLSQWVGTPLAPVPSVDGLTPTTASHTVSTVNRPAPGANPASCRPSGTRRASDLAALSCRTVLAVPGVFAVPGAGQDTNRAEAYPLNPSRRADVSSRSERPPRNRLVRRPPPGPAAAGSRR